MQQLIARWRVEAETLIGENFHSGALLLNDCADELEQAWHDDEHGAAWIDGCLPCELEQRTD